MKLVQALQYLESNYSEAGSKKRKALKKVGNGKEPAKKKAKEAKKKSCEPMAR